ncbi:MAG: hypothetical protein R3F04_04100 [Lysobacteraceae bacterium]
MSSTTVIDLVELMKEALRFHAPGAVDAAKIRSYVDWRGCVSPVEADIVVVADELVASGFAVVTATGWQIVSATKE